MSTMTSVPAERARDRTGWGVDLKIVGAAVALAGLAWLLWAGAAGVALEVPAGDHTREVGLASVLLSAASASLAGTALLRLLEARTPRGQRTWTMAATLVFLVSHAGPLGATTPEAALGLASMHVVVGAVVILGLRAVRESHAP